MNPWRVTDRGDQVVAGLADRHYTRQKVGAASFTRPGYTYILIARDAHGAAGWIWWRPKWEAGIGRQDKLEAIECTLFRNETRILSSDLVRAAVDALGWPAARAGLHGITWPRDGIITGVQSAPTARRRSKKALPGKCYREAGWVDFEHPSKSRKTSSAVDVWLKYPGPRPVELPDPQQTIFDAPRQETGIQTGTDGVGKDSLLAPPAAGGVFLP